MEDTLKKLLISQDTNQGKVAPPVPDILFPPIKRNKVYTFVSSYTAQAITVTTGFDANIALSISLSNFNNVTEYTALFDAYRVGITKVSYNQIAFAGGGVLANIHSVIDYDDSNATAVAAMQQYDSYQIDPVESTFTRVFQPLAANAAYSGTFTSFSRMPSTTWCDVASPGIQYYGFKAQIPASTFSGGPVIVAELVVTSVLQFRNTR